MSTKNKQKYTQTEWWRGAIMYHVYPRSFLDTTGNGVGDLYGITQKLDYIASLGVDGIWISPFFKSPMKDFGYDVQDYRTVDPLFGDLDAFKALLAKAHDLGLKILVDMVLSHTSDQHPWFEESRSSKSNPKADWYVWGYPKPDGSPPNNWLSMFGGSAWQFDVFRGQYYLHNFLKEQPDLNYHNEEVADAMLDECRFWLDLGVDGLRLDVINFCMHDKMLRDNPPKDEHTASSQLDFPDAYSMQRHLYDKSQPEFMPFLRRLRALLDEYPDRMALAEVGDDDQVQISAQYTGAPDLLHTAYNFTFMMDKGQLPKASFFRSAIEDQAKHGQESWPSWAFSNHDVVRAASRWSGTDYMHNPDLSRLLMALLCSFRGTVFIYQGEELGLPEVQIAYEDLHDPWGKYLYKMWQGRDGCRTPIPWDSAAKHAGFSQADKTWLPVGAAHLPLAVNEQETDPSSQLAYTRRLLAWRKSLPAISRGEIEFIDVADENDCVLAFARRLPEQTVKCIFNLSPNEVEIPLQRVGVAQQSETFHETISHAGKLVDRLFLPSYGFAFFESK